MAVAVVVPDEASRYWSYKTLLEDKKRCLTNVGHVKHEFCNSLEKEGEDPKTSQRALAERKRHHRGELNKSWHRGGDETPPHDYEREGGRPHFSQKEFQEKKKKMQTEIRQNSSRRSSDLHNDNESMRALMNHNEYEDNTGFMSEKAALSDRRGSSEPHNSQRVLAMKKRHHATSVHSRSRSESPRSSHSWGSTQPSARSHHGMYPYGEVEVFKPDFRAREDKYKSQYALQQNKRHHLAEIHSGGDQHYDTESNRYHSSPYDGEAHRLGQSMSEKGLFTSQKALCFAKRGHIIDLKNVEGFGRRRASSARSAHSDGSSSCDVGKGISRMMHNHREDQVHNSHTEFTLKKKNHATSVHKAPKDDASDCTSVSSRASFGMHALNDTRRASDPHHSCRAFALKKKYHVTQVHAKSESRLHPEQMKHRSVDMDPKSLSSHAQLNKMKRVHRLEPDAASRSKSEPRPTRQAPMPRSGQWTPQHLD
jgi:hypothetical protein